MKDLVVEAAIKRLDASLPRDDEGYLNEDVVSIDAVEDALTAIKASADPDATVNAWIDANLGGAA